MGVRVPRGELTVVLGPPIVRRRLMAMLDDDAPGVRRLSAPPGATAARRVQVIEAVADDVPALVLAERVTEDLDAAGRRVVLTALRALARTGPAVLVDDDDAVAALAVADATLRADPLCGLTVEPVGLPALSA